MTRPFDPFPIPGEPETASALEMVVVPRIADLGGFQVRRALPSSRRQMVGPFIFLDAFGPATFKLGDGLDVRPHPHIGLATVTYLLGGEITHKDSLGSDCAIRPGDLNWMMAGKGIVHSERTPSAERMKGAHLRGLQAWVALPTTHEDGAPDFAHHDISEQPVIASEGKAVRLIAGSLYGQEAPVKTASSLFYADATLKAGSRLPLDAGHEERALYLLQGEIRIAGDIFEPERLLIFRPGDVVMIEAVTDARFLLMGGAPLDGPRYIWWNFVSSSPKKIEQARDEWTRGRFDIVPGDPENFMVPA
jgi:redox-sensitive bicupin YhaK (pirin superfamily)